MGPPEIIPCRRGTSREGTGASHADAQRTFLEMMGLLESTDVVSIEPTLSEMEAEIFCSALDHEYYEEVETDDKYFTPEEFRRLAAHTSRAARHVLQRFREPTPMTIPEQDSIVEQYGSYSTSCKCAAHVAFHESEDRFFRDCLGRLISTPSDLLTDYYGGEIVESLLPFLFKKGEYDMNIRRVCAGSPFSVNFVLQMPSGKMYHFTGRPDFTIHGPYHGVITPRRSLTAIGEIQSAPGRAPESKTAALSQAGVYTIGQFTKQGASTMLPAVVLHKDKTVQVAIASLNGAAKRAENSLGTVSFKLVGRVEPVDLKTTEGLLTFSGQLKGVMDATRGT